MPRPSVRKRARSSKRRVRRAVSRTKAMEKLLEKLQPESLPQGQAAKPEITKHRASNLPGYHAITHMEGKELLRVIRPATSRTLTFFQITDAKKRAAVHRIIQELSWLESSFMLSSSQRETAQLDMQAKKLFSKLSKLLGGKKKASAFMAYLGAAHEKIYEGSG